MRPAVLICAAALLAGAGCGGASESEPEPASPSEVGAPPASDQGADEQVIRGWSEAVNRGDYEAAADFFADGAVVEQLTETRLETHAEAVAFNRSLPCRADVTDVEEGEESSLAAFVLREGRSGECGEGGSARVRFVISDGEIDEWRQLPPAPEPDGDTA